MTKIEPVDIDFFSPFNEEACIPCGECLNNCPIMDFTIEESIIFARTIKAKTVIPMHYDMYTLNTANVADFVSQAQGKLNYKIAQIGVPFLL